MGWGDERFREQGSQFISKLLQDQQSFPDERLHSKQTDVSRQCRTKIWNQISCQRSNFHRDAAIFGCHATLPQKALRDIQKKKLRTRLTTKLTIRASALHLRANDGGLTLETSVSLSLHVGNLNLINLFDRKP